MNRQSLKATYADSVKHKLPDNIKLYDRVKQEEKWGDRDSLEFTSVYGDESCNECGTEVDSEYCQRCEPAME